MFGIISAAALCAAPQKADYNIFEAGEFKALCPLDEIVLRNLKAKKIEPARICSDAVFVRRVYLDITGALPGAEAARSFIQDKSTQKRKELVESLLNSQEYAEYAAFRWADILKIKAEFPINLWPNAAQAYHKLINLRIDANEPYPKIATELLTSCGSNFREPAVNFFRAMQGRTPENSAAAVAAAFLGWRFDKLPKDKQDNFAKFFSKISYKGTKEWKEEIVFFDPLNRQGFEGVLPNGQKITVNDGVDPRKPFAAWLTQDPQFYKNFANRTFGRLTGNYLTSDPDDMPNAEVYNAELLNYLTKEFQKSGGDIKGLYRLILNSNTYAQSSMPRADEASAEKNQAVYKARQLEAEVLIDAICKVTGTSEIYSSTIPEPYTSLPTNKRAVSIPDGSISTAFLELFGKSQRDTGTEAERSSEASPSQRLYILNSTHIRLKIENSPLLNQIIEEYKKDASQHLYLTILSRLPSDEEMSIINKDIKSAKKPGAFFRDLAWALINSEEFLNRH